MFIDSFLDLMERGGPVMWVIFVTAWLAIIMLIERALRIQRWLRHAAEDHSRLNHSDPFSPPQESSSPVARLSRHLPWQEIRSPAELSEHINARLADLMPKLEGSLPTIAIIGSLLPMLGLLGTVTGMIEVFQVIALQGTGDPQKMAHGISQALLTTASGLIIAIPVIFAHHVLVRRLRLLLSITEQSLHLLQKRELTTLSSHAAVED